MEAHIEALTRQNAELVLWNMEQAHPKENWDGHEEEERNSHINGPGCNAPNLSLQIRK
jgi:hypothetical protein